jgi:hypothetical protein
MSRGAIWWRVADEDYLAGKCIACCYGPSFVLAIDRFAGLCARARGAAGATAADPARRSYCRSLSSRVIAAAADPARRSYCRSLPSRVIAAAASATPRAHRTITRIRRTRTRCAGQGGESDKRLIKEARPILRRAMAAESGVLRTSWLGGRLRIPLSLQTDGIGGFNPSS